LRWLPFDTSSISQGRKTRIIEFLAFGTQRRTSRRINKALEKIPEACSATAHRRYEHFDDRHVDYLFEACSCSHINYKHTFNDWGCHRNDGCRTKNASLAVERRKFSRRDTKHNFAKTPTLEWFLEHAKLVEDNTETPNIASWTVTIAPNNLWRHVSGRAHARHLVASCSARKNFGDAKVAKLEKARRCQKHVGRLHIPVHHAVGMDMRKSGKQLREQSEDRNGLKGTTSFNLELQ
jgi:hypothetical protein